MERMDLSPGPPSGNPFTAVHVAASAAANAANAFGGALKRPAMESSMTYHETTTGDAKRPVGDDGFSATQKVQLAELMQTLVLNPLQADIKALREGQASQAGEVASLKSRVDDLAAKTMDNGDISALVKSEVKKHAE